MYCNIHLYTGVTIMEQYLLSESLAVTDSSGGGGGGAVTHVNRRRAVLSGGGGIASIYPNRGSKWTR